jgi:hypothetical protein
MMMIMMMMIIIIIIIIIILQPELGAKFKTFIIEILATLHFIQIDAVKLPIFARGTEPTVSHPRPNGGRARC